MGRPFGWPFLYLKTNFIVILTNYLVYCRYLVLMKVIASTIAMLLALPIIAQQPYDDRRAGQKGNAVLRKEIKPSKPAKSVHIPAARPTPRPTPVKNSRRILIDSLVQLIKGRLQLPFYDCTLLESFGPINNGISTIYNPGITFSSPAPVTAKACYDGVVEQVVQIEGMKVVLVSNGPLYFGYSNLADVTVQRGDSITTGQPIGTLAQDDYGNYTLLFLLSIDNKDEDPAPWFDAIIAVE